MAKYGAVPQICIFTLASRIREEDPEAFSSPTVGPSYQPWRYFFGETHHVRKEHQHTCIHIHP